MSETAWQILSLVGLVLLALLCLALQQACLYIAANAHKWANEDKDEPTKKARRD